MRRLSMDINYMCYWCHKSTMPDFKITEDNMEVYLCDNCKKAYETKTCINCGKVSSRLLHGKCLICNQMEVAERLEKMSDYFGIDAYTMLRQSGDNTKMSDDEFEKWVSLKQPE